jgi:hypothetical protein
MRCAKCRRRVGKAVAMEDGRRYVAFRHPDAAWGLAANEPAMRCKCGYRPSVNLADVGAAAPRAWAQGRDLMIGAPGYGLRAD